MEDLARKVEFSKESPAFTKMFLQNMFITIDGVEVDVFSRALHMIRWEGV